MIFDPGLKLLFLLPIVAMLALFIVYFLWPRAGSDLRTLEELGSWDGVQFDVLSDPRGRRRVSVHLTIGNDPPANIRGLMGSREASRLARMLRIAAAPGKNLAAARYAFTASRRVPPGG